MDLFWRLTNELNVFIFLNLIIFLWEKKVFKKIDYFLNIVNLLKQKEIDKKLLEDTFEKNQHHKEN